jgi:hypothetical protein
MYTVGMIGSKQYPYDFKVREFVSLLRRRFGTTPIVLSGGEKTGAEPAVKKYALQFGMDYREFNPSYTGHNLYSMMEESYYGKPYHFTHLIHRYQEMIRRCDYLVIFKEEGVEDKALEAAEKAAQKKGIKIVLIH